jgi:sporulation protein YlmC with PRC-barrel domain
MLGAAPFMAAADNSMPADPAATQIADTLTNANGEVDAGKLIGKEVYDGTGNKVGEIDSVMVDPKGKVSSVVIDVSGWLESEKLVSVKWSDLKADQDGKIVSSLTKESAKAAAAYNYKDKSLRGQVMTESGEPYSANNQPATTDGSTAATAPATTGGSTAATTAPATGDNTATTNAKTDNSLVNADGSLNASKLIGLDVKSPEDKKVGDIGEVVLDKDGKAEGVIVDVGGFLGIATHPVLLSWKDVQITSQDGKASAVVNLTKDKLEQMPAYESSSK